MPLDLQSTAPLRGEKPKRRWTLIVMGHGRWEYLNESVRTIQLSGYSFEKRVIAMDGAVAAHGWFTESYALLDRQGLTANLAQAWGALTDEDDWVFFVEEDFLIGDAPLDAMADTLEANPDLAQMALVRQPWSAEEHHAGGMLHGPHYRGGLTDEGGWLRQRRLFTLNPFVARASLLRTLQAGVETVLTEQCLARGLSFGFWGGIDDPPRVEHIGREGGMGSPGWRP